MAAEEVSREAGMVTAPQGVCALYGAVSASDGYQGTVTGWSLAWSRLTV